MKDKCCKNCGHYFAYTMLNFNVDGSRRFCTFGGGPSLFMALHQRYTMIDYTVEEADKLSWFLPEPDKKYCCQHWHKRGNPLTILPKHTQDRMNAEKGNRIAAEELKKEVPTGEKKKKKKKKKKDKKK